MTSKLETRIATQKYHGISSAAWWKLTDEEQEALIQEAATGHGITCEDNDYRCCEADTCPAGCAHRLWMEGDDEENE